jgi:hypothetical protein
MSMASISVELKHTLQKVLGGLLDVKNASLILLLGFLLYQILYDSCIRGPLELLGQNQAMIDQETTHFSDKIKQFERYQRLAKTMTEVPIKVLTRKPTDSTSVLIAREAEKIVNYIKGINRAPGLTAPLPSPHDRLQLLTLRPTGATPVIFSTESPRPQSVEPAASAPNPGSPPAPPHGEGKEGSASAPPIQRAGPPVAIAPAAEPEGFKGEQFQFDIAVRGTYPACMDLINQLTQHPYLLTLNQGTITPLPATANEVEMHVALSVFIADAL